MGRWRQPGLNALNQTFALLVNLVLRVEQRPALARALGLERLDRLLSGQLRVEY